MLYSGFPEEDHVGGVSTMVDELAFGEEATTFDAAVADNARVIERVPSRSSPPRTGS